MKYRFVPSGQLDLATDPAALPQENGDGMVVSGAMTRCTNLRLDRRGRATTRWGSTRFSDAAVAGGSRLAVHAGNRYIFTPTAIYRNGVSLASGLTAGTDWQTLAYNAYNVTTQALFATDGANRKRIEGTTVREWGIEAPATAPTVTGTVGGAYMHAWELSYGHVTAPAFHWTTTAGTYEVLYDWEADFLGGDPLDAGDAYSPRPMYLFESSGFLESWIFGYCYTYCRKSGAVLECESNPSPEALVNGMSGHGVTWTASADAQVTHVRIYRTLAGGAAYLYADEVEIGTVSAGLGLNDDALGTEVAYDHDRPPSGIVALAGPDFNGYLFALVGNLVYWCKAKQPEYWPALSYVEIGAPQDAGTALAMLAGTAYAFSRHHVAQIQGSGTDSFFPVPFRPFAGAVAADAVFALEGSGIFHVGPDGGLYLFTGAASTRIDNAFRPITEGTTIGGVPGLAQAAIAQCKLVGWRGRVWLAYPSSDYPDNFLLADSDVQRLQHYQYTETFRSFAIDKAGQRLLALDDSGYVWELEASEATDDNGTAIASDLESKEFGDTIRTQFPRSAKYDVELAPGASAFGFIVLDGTSVQTHALRSREIQNRLVATSNGKRLSIRITGTGPIVVRQAEVE